MKRSNPTSQFCDAHHVIADPKLMLAIGVWPNVSTISKFGANEDVDIGTEDVWSHGGLLNYPASASIMNIASLSANDTLLGTGMRTMRIEGLDTNFLEISETVEMDGQNIVTTDNSYIRVHRMYAVESGSSETNEGEIHAFTGTATAGLPDDETQTYSQISSDHGQTLVAAYTVPANKTGFLTYGYATTDSANKPAEIKMFIRPDADTATASWRIAVDLKIADSFRRPFDIPLRIEGKTDIKVQTTAEANNTYVSAGFDLIMIDNGV